MLCASHTPPSTMSVIYSGIKRANDATLERGLQIHGSRRQMAASSPQEALLPCSEQCRERALPRTGRSSSSLYLPSSSPAAPAAVASSRCSDSDIFDGTTYDSGCPTTWQRNVHPETAMSSAGIFVAMGASQGPVHGGDGQHVSRRRSCGSRIDCGRSVGQERGSVGWCRLFWSSGFVALLLLRLGDLGRRFWHRSSRR